ncbi:MAG TPA: ABC transporter ATP-binding protein [Micromonosporaceae bacterium]|nr:ABC transporter ATP-binding protein [Micromonosporaceae bacterium]
MTVLSVDGLTVHHGQLAAVVDLDLAVGEGETLAIIGANGAGKTTLLRTIAGVLRPTTGTIRYDGQDVTRMPAHRRVAAGIALVPEGRRLFPALTVAENLATGAYRKRPGPWSVDRIIELFPWMADRTGQAAASLSGGEQQAVAIGRALATNPRLLLLDELSLGLAPIVVRGLYERLPEILAQGTTVLLVEQDVSQALRVADQVCCLRGGRAALRGRPADLSAEQIQAAYFGAAATRNGDADADGTANVGALSVATGSDAGEETTR